MGLPEKKTRDPLTLGSSEKLVHYIQWWIRFNAALSRSLRLTSQLGLEWDAADQAKQFKLWDVQPALEQGDCTDWWGLLWYSCSFAQLKKIVSKVLNGTKPHGSVHLV